MDLRRLIENFNNIVILTGSGISVPSGIKTFIETDTAWDYEFPRLEVMSAPFFKQEPQRFWEIFAETWEDFEKYSPNQYHKILQKIMKKEQNKNILLATQNVDNLHTKLDPDIIETHGNITNLICLKCRNISEFNEDIRLAAKNGKPPKCLKCREILKPNVSLFFEGITGFGEIRDAIVQPETLLIVIGTALTVGPFNELPYFLRRDLGSVAVWVNKVSAPEAFDFDYELKIDFLKDNVDFLLNGNLKENFFENVSFDDLLNYNGS